MTPASFRVFARALRAAADIFDAAASEATDERLDWVDQSSSPLGSRRHIAAVRRRMTLGSDGAAQVGRRFLLSRDALTEELGRASDPVPTEDESTDYTERVRSELRMVQGGSR